MDKKNKFNIFLHNCLQIFYLTQRKMLTSYLNKVIHSKQKWRIQKNDYETYS